MKWNGKVNFAKREIRLLYHLVNGYNPTNDYDEKTIFNLEKNLAF